MTSHGLSVRAAADEAPRRAALIGDGLELDWEGLRALVESRIEEVRAPGGSAQGSAGWILRHGLVGTRDLDTLVTLLSFLELGEPVVLLHPRAPGEHRRQLQSLGSPPLWPQGPGRLHDRDRRAGAASREVHDHAPGDDERILAVLFTSGSSGTAKAVALSRRAFEQSAMASRSRLDSTASDRWLLSLTPAHVGGLSIITRALFDRATIVLADRDGFDASSLVRQVNRDRVTFLSLVPTMLHRVVQSGLQAPASLRAVLVGGAHAPEHLLAAARELGWPVRATYGLTEACSQVATQRSAIQHFGGRAPSCGRPLDGVEVRISADGEIELRGRTLFSGYLVQDPSGPLRLDRSPFDDEDWFATGDEGDLVDGELLVRGRRDDRIVTGGENVSPAEVEQVLLAHPAINGCSVVGIDDQEWGEIVAAVVVADGDAVPQAEVERHLGETLARFKHPRRIVWLPALPETASGKIDREACRMLLMREG